MTLKKHLLIAILPLSMLFSFGVLISDNVPVNAQAEEGICETLGANGQECGPSGQSNNINNIIATAINLLSFVAGVASVIMLIIGGFKYITSAGDSGAVSSAKNTILYAIVGLIIVAMSQFIVRFVLSTTDGAPNGASTSAPVEPNPNTNPNIR